MRHTREKPNALAWLGLSVLVIVLDQWTKWLALHSLQPYTAQEVIPGVLNWMLAFNTGAAFSFLAGAGGWQRWFFIMLAVVISVVLTVWLYRSARRDWRTALPLALIIGGAIGNVIDRVRFGKVTDFIQVYYQQWAWPAFNIADSAICVGAVLMITFSLFAAKSQPDVR